MGASKVLQVGGGTTRMSGDNPRIWGHPSYLETGALTLGYFYVYLND